MILARLSADEAAVTELAELFPNLSLPAISKHQKALQPAGLITQGRKAQWRPWRLAPGPLKEVDAWIERYRPFYAESFDRLDEYLREIQVSHSADKPQDDMPTKATHDDVH